MLNYCSILSDICCLCIVHLVFYSLLRFRVLLTTIHLEPDRVEDIVLACCVLHNLMRTKYPILTINLLDVEDPLTHQVTSGAWRSNTTLENLEVMKGNNMTKAAKAQRDYLRDYFQSPEGAVSWQDSMIWLHRPMTSSPVVLLNRIPTGYLLLTMNQLNFEGWRSRDTQSETRSLDVQYYCEHGTQCYGGIVWTSAVAVSLPQGIHVTHIPKRRGERRRRNGWWLHITRADKKCQNCSLYLMVPSLFSLETSQRFSQTDSAPPYANFCAM